MSGQESIVVTSGGQLESPNSFCKLQLSQGRAHFKIYFAGLEQREHGGKNAPKILLFRSATWSESQADSRALFSGWQCFGDITPR